MERTVLNYNKQDKSMFLYAYRAFIAALAKNDRVTLKKMTEPYLYSILCKNHDALEKHNCQYFSVEGKGKIQMK